MKRRDATALLTALAAGNLISLPLPLLLSGCKETAATGTLSFFTQEEMNLLEQVSETILPPTPQSAGAIAAGIGPFMDRYVADCLEVRAQEVLRQGLGLFSDSCQEQYNSSFLKLQPDQRQEFLVALDIEAENYQQQLLAGASPHYFTLLKGLTLLGYFTSEAGATQALRYLPIPGKYEGNIPYQDGDKAWAI